jgi:hypothetical protein
MKVRVQRPLPVHSLGTLSTKGFTVPGLPAGSYLEYGGLFTNPIFTGDSMSASQYEKIGFTPPFDSTNLPSSPASYGAQAFNQMRPQIAKAGAGQFIAELRDLPGMLKQTAKGFSDGFNQLFKNNPVKDLPRMPKSASDHFLNHHFGWVPFISDIGKLYETASNIEAIIDQTVKDNGLWIRRRRSVLEQTTSARIALNINSLGCEPNVVQLCKPLTVENLACSGTYHQTFREVKTSVWAEGAFKYYRPIFDRDVPGFDSSLNDARRRLAIYGAEINPALLYKITPWTWLIDWFTGFGRIVDNANSIAFDGVVCRYLYIMQRQVQTIIQYCTLNLYSGAQTLSFERIIDSKQRACADGPYGFVSPASLSTKQIAILGALGLSKAF